MSELCDKPEHRTSRSVHLAPREREVLHHYSAGLTYDQIARRMGLTRHTVDTYLRRIRAKTGAGSVPELVRIADTITRRRRPPVPPPRSS